MYLIINEQACFCLLTSTYIVGAWIGHVLGPSVGLKIERSGVRFPLLVMWSKYYYGLSIIFEWKFVHRRRLDENAIQVDYKTIFKLGYKVQDDFIVFSCIDPLRLCNFNPSNTSCRHDRRSTRYKIQDGFIAFSCIQLYTHKTLYT